jgi:hypothetical protein
LYPSSNSSTFVLPAFDYNFMFHWPPFCPLTRLTHIYRKPARVADGLADRYPPVPRLEKPFFGNGSKSWLFFSDKERQVLFP